MATPGKYKKALTDRMQQEVDAYRTTHKGNRHTKEGHEVLNPTPLAPQLGAKPQPSLADQMRQQIIASKRLAELDVMETEEEADDFDIADDPIIQSPWENDLVPSLKETRSVLRQLEEQERRFADAEAAQAKAKALTDPRAKPPKAGVGVAGEDEAK